MNKRVCTSLAHKKSRTALTIYMAYSRLIILGILGILFSCGLPTVGPPSPGSLVELNSPGDNHLQFTAKVLVNSAQLFLLLRAVDPEDIEELKDKVTDSIVPNTLLSSAYGFYNYNNENNSPSIKLEDDLAGKELKFDLYLSAEETVTNGVRIRVVEDTVLKIDSALVYELEQEIPSDSRFIIAAYLQVQQFDSSNSKILFNFDYPLKFGVGN